MVSSNPLNLDNLTARQQSSDRTTTANVVNPVTGLATGVRYSLVFNNCATATSATTGSASALPTDPAGYVEILIAGAVMKLPYYNV